MLGEVKVLIYITKISKLNGNQLNLNTILCMNKYFLRDIIIIRKYLKP